MPVELAEKVLELKKRRNAVILAHNYQIGEVQDVADFVGDSLGLSVEASKADAEVIVFCGVHFMAESAAILAPEKTVLLPDRHAGCPLANMITVDDLERKKAEHPGAVVVCYVNSSAAVKAASDVCCTSANAVAVVNGVIGDEILFVPDRNLANYVSLQTDKRIIPWDGYCLTHQRVTVESVQKVRQLHPDALIVVHPECRPEVVAMADHVASTSGLLRFSRATEIRKIIVGTEMGLLHRLKQEVPDKEFYLLDQGLVCPNMKLTTLEKVVRALETMEPRITVSEEVTYEARKALDRMLEIV